MKIVSKNITIGGLNIRYFFGGQGPALVIVHGGGEGAEGWQKTMGIIARKYTIYVPDLPGWGESQPLSGDYYIPELVQFINRFVEKMGIDRFHLMGHSLGGGIAISFALNFPQKVEKLVLVSSLCLGKEIALWVRLLTVPKLSSYMAKFAHTLMSGVKWLVDSLINPIIRVNFANPISVASISLGDKVVTFGRQALILADRLPELRMPTLVVWGGRDPVLPVSHAYVAARLIPNCRLKVFDDCGHSVYRERAAEFTQTVYHFLD